MTSTDVAVPEAVEIASVTLFGTDNPAQVVERAAAVARTLERLVRSQGLVVRIGQSDHVRVEGWTLLGSMLGVFPVVEWTRPVMDGDAKVGWEARVEARTRGGEVVGAAEAECLRDERTWKGREDYALRSMAQTRAVSKAMRLPLGFVMQIAGFSPTPAEEMPDTVRRGDRSAVIDAPASSTEIASPAPPADDGLFPPRDAPAAEVLAKNAGGEVPTLGADTSESDAATSASSSPAVISDAQRRRLRAIQNAAGVTDEALKAMVDAIAGVASSKLIPVAKYEALVTAVEAAGGEPESAYAKRAAEAQASRSAS